MQKRYHVQRFSKFEDALAEKNKLKENGKSYQIRKREQGKHFDLVMRVSANENQAHPENLKKSRRRR